MTDVRRILLFLMGLLALGFAELFAINNYGFTSTILVWWACASFWQSVS
jgi:hypothetical protein